MKAWLSTGGAILGVMLAVFPVRAQISSASRADASQPLRAAILRKIDDPATGNRWLLERDLEHPGGPGRLVLAAGGIAAVANAENGVPSAGAAIPKLPVVRAGEDVTLVAHTPVMDAELEAVALAAAGVGAPLPVRLKIGGRIVQAIVLGPRRAAWTPGSGELR